MPEKIDFSRRAFLVGGAGAVALSALPGQAAQAQRAARYSNPVTKTFSDVFADPTVILGKDGNWYGYCTGDPLLHRHGDYSLPKVGIARSSDMITWEYAGAVLDEDPAWAPDGSFYWAPDIRYVDGLYYLYFSVAHFGDVFYTALGLATSASPTGPWTDSGAPLQEASGSQAAIDAALFTDLEGTRYLYWGSFREEGIIAARLNPAGTRIVTKPTQVCVTGEAPYVVRRGKNYYLFLSESVCCAGDMSGYTVLVGRSQSPLGPFADRDGIPLTDARYGGSIVLTANGNRWVGTGHMAIATDLSGQEWMAYHAIDKDDPYLQMPGNDVNERPMLLDRLDWIDGWPIVRAGAFASDAPQTAPVATWAIGGHVRRGDDLGDAWMRAGAATDGWHIQSSDADGAYIRQRKASTAPSYLVARRSAPAQVRAEADLRVPGGPGAAGLLLAYRDENNHAVAWLDADKGALITDVLVDGDSQGRTSTPLHDKFRFDTWHNVAGEIRSGKLRIEVTSDRLGAPLGMTTRTLPASTVAGSVGIAARGGQVEAAGVGANKLYRPVTTRVPEPQPGEMLADHSDEFDDGSLGSRWAWVRDPVGTESDGRYRWPMQAAQLSPEEKSASLLLRPAPSGDYLVETSVTLPLQPSMSQHYEAGLVVYASDGLNLRLTTSLFEPLYVPPTSTRLIRTRLTKQAHGALGWEPVGVPGDITWLRLACHVDGASGEREFRAATSRDGQEWTWGGTWSLPTGMRPRIGILGMGGSGAVAEFSYFRVHKLGGGGNRDQ